MKKLLVIITTVLLIIASVACSKSASVSSKDGAVPPNVPPVTATRPAVTQVPAPTIIIPGKTGSGAADQSTQYGGIVENTDRMIVRTGNLVLVVDNVATSIEQISKLTDGFKGYIVSSNSWKEGDRLVGVISVRVPVERFNDAIRAFRALAVDVQSETTTSKDVTEEYSDLSARLKNLEAAEKQLVLLLDKAQKVEDILAIQRELTNTRGQIEQIKGRMQYLERTSSTSLIEVSLSQSQLSADFSGSVSRVIAGEEIRFSAKIAGGFAPYSYEWSFGDGQTSTDPYPVYAYKSAGTYTVSFKVTDDRGGTASKIRKDYIIVQPGWDIGRVAGSAWNGLVTLGRVLANVLIWLVIFIPVWIVGGGIAYFVWRRRRKAH